MWMDRRKDGVDPLLDLLLQSASKNIQRERFNILVNDFPSPNCALVFNEKVILKQEGDRGHRGPGPITCKSKVEPLGLG